MAKAAATCELASDALKLQLHVASIKACTSPDEKEAV